MFPRNPKMAEEIMTGTMTKIKFFELIILFSGVLTAPLNKEILENLSNKRNVLLI